MFCSSVLVFGGTEGDGYHFLILRAQTHFRRHRGRRIPISCFALHCHFRRFRGRRVPFSCFPLSGLFLALPRATVFVFLFCATGLIFGVTEGVWSRFHVLHTRTRFRRNRGRRVPFSCFKLPDAFSAVPRETGTVFLFCTPKLIFDCSGSVGYRFHVLRARNHFRRYQGRRVPF
jgi:hypothetical protein